MPLPEEILAAQKQPWPSDQFLDNVLAHGISYGATIAASETSDSSPIDIQEARRQQLRLLPALLGEARHSLKLYGAESELLDRYDGLVDEVSRFSAAGSNREVIRALQVANREGLPTIFTPFNDGLWVNFVPFITRLGSHPVVAQKALVDPRPPDKYRFYLNPPLIDVPKVIDRLFHDDNLGDVLFHGKFIDLFDPEGYARKDRIILYCQEDEVAELYKVLQSIKASLPEAFHDRPLPALPYPIEDGIGFAASTPGKSYGRQRTELLIEALAETETELRLAHPARRVSILRSHLSSTALSRGIDSVNIAFNQE